MKKAFTLIELIITIVILSVIAALALPAFQSLILESKVRATTLEACALQREAKALAKFENRSTLTSVDFSSNDFDKTVSGTQSAVEATIENAWSYTSKHGVTVYIQSSGVVSSDLAGLVTKISCASTEIESSEPVNTFSATFDTQGGSGISPVVVSQSSSLADPGNSSRNGYNFLGWFENPSGGASITFPYAVNQSSNFTLYAQWSEQSLDVTGLDGSTNISGQGTFVDSFNGLTVTRNSSGTRLQFNTANWEFVETTASSVDTLYKTTGPDSVGVITKNDNRDIDIAIPFGNSFILKIKYNGGSSGMNYFIG